MNNNGGPEVPMVAAPPATSAVTAPAMDSPAADVPVANVPIADILPDNTAVVSPADVPSDNPAAATSIKIEKASYLSFLQAAVQKSEDQTSSSKEVTSKRLLAAINSHIFVEVSFASAIYWRTYHCKLIPNGVKLKVFLQKMGKMDGLEHWVPELEATESVGKTSIKLLRRCNQDLVTLELDVLRQLGMAEDMRAMVLGPRLCYVIVMMCGMRVDLMTGPIIDSMFSVITRRCLASLYVVTREGIQSMSPDDICDMVKRWVSGLSRFISDDGGVEDSLVVAKQCNMLYEQKCAEYSLTVTTQCKKLYKHDCGVRCHNDADCHIAEIMLKNEDLYSELFLGNQEDELEVLYKCLVDVVGKRTSKHINVRLRQLSKSSL
ncbi:hypothetical protein GGI09_007654 [Coemansia sp. S100]|nr:hypothetical protein LPJ71_002807 [Coemansia sp. S17]KAJ2081151.1 hypothetical protein GGI09_007654 [Coemansia sp. S100]KAJ2082289.1 hypothetical protein GGI16_007364 [Coemansia sp. S142-1]